MNEYMLSYRRFPLWAVLLLTIPVGLGAWGVSSARYQDTVAGTPLFALFAYGLAVGYVNRASIRVTPEGVGIGFGPLPCGVPPEWVPREEIARVYLRHVSRAHGPYWAAGIERTDGRWQDLSDPLAATDLVRVTVQEIAAALAWEEPIALLRGQPPAHDRKQKAPLLLWGSMLAAAFAWGLLQSI